tara:strand:+ start:289 stop:2073 length:1785 start_codon:yes stop_codon:yes gene_type:complete
MTRPTPEEIDFKYNLKVYFGLLKPYTKSFILVLFLVLFVEASHIIPKFFFKIIIDKGDKFLEGAIPTTVFTQLIIAMAIAYIILIFLRSLANWFDHYILARLDGNLIFDIKQKFFNHIVHLSHNFHTTNKTGSLISRLSRGGRAVESMTDTLIFNFAPLFFQVAVVGTALLTLSWIPALVAVLTIIIFIVYSLTIQNLQKEANMHANDQEDFEKGNIADIFTNIDSIKYFGKEKAIKRKFKNISSDTKRKTIRHWNFYNWLSSGQSLILGLGTFFAIYFPMIEFLNHSLTLGELVFIWTVYGNLVGPMFSFVHGIRNYYRVMADFESLFSYGKIENEVKDKAHAKTLNVKHGTIDFNSLSFKYHKRKIFSNFDLQVKRNQKVALVGHSGCGKSTLIKLLYRLYDVERGQIQIDGKDIRDFKQESLRSELSIVPQECVLFDDTIYNNIKFSNPKATKKQVIQAMKFAQLWKIVNMFPKKENTIVGERGVKLSGGEKQRVSIARAVLANKKILVLDEATSSLDSETEHEIQKDLEKLMNGRTSIIIAHRLSTIMHADKIVVMEKGKIVQIGTHRQLINKKGAYKKLWNLQKGGYIK